jgi:peptidoglycan hydrolase-like protein with peptidoglycan-binding domain
MASQTVIERLRAGGIVSPKMCAAEAARAGLPLEYAAALLEKESAGGHNVFGHDRDRGGNYIFPARDGTVKVTKELYLDYKKRRVASGNKAMQGVGPCQLTWFSFQDDADKEGGCWKPQINMRIGFRRLASLMKTHGEAVGARMYNGSGPAAEAYSKDLRSKAAAWRSRLDGAAPVPLPAAGGPLRRGDRGAKVVRLTRRLSKVRSKAGTPYLAKPRRQLDATAEAALKAFQAEHRLEPDGVYGPLSQRKLNRVLRLQEKQREEEPAADKKVVKRTRLKSLVVDVQRRDAETGEAWETLVEHAAKRRALLRRLQAAKTATGAGGAALNATVAEGFAAVTAALEEIDATLDTLVATEQEETAAAVAVSEVVATAGGGAPPAVSPPETESPDGATVTQAPPPTPPAPEGPAPPSPVAVPPPAPGRRELTELSDDELLERIERLDRALDRSRATMIRRFAAVEKDIRVLAPERREMPVREPKRKPQPKPAEPTPTGPGDMPRERVKGLQKALNGFTNKHLKSFGPLMVDGVVGPATKKRIREAKAYLGYTGAARRSSTVDRDFMRRLRHPRSVRFSSPAMLARALDRRRKQRKAAKESMAPRAGVATFDGKPVAAWLKPYLVWARNNGWKGTLNSGWRDPVYSETLCRNMCGAPSCPGRCAGRTSNHAGSVRPAGALDVSDYQRFAELMRRCPLQPRIFNALGARDPVHFSVSGR